MKKILIIEDEEPLRRALSIKLKQEGFDIIEGKDGEEGLTLALSEHPDLILLDLILPKMDGFVMLEKMRADTWGKNAPVIILTNFNSKEYVLKSFRDEVYNYIIKTDNKMEDIIKIVKAKLAE